MDSSLPQAGRTLRSLCMAGKNGFSLVEMLVVLAIITLLMAASNVLIRSPRSKAGEPAARLARCIEFARAQAVAGNRKVAVRFDPQPSGERELVMRFLRSRPGEATDEEIREFRRPERFQDIRISKEVVIASASNGKGQSAADSHQDSHALGEEESLVITPDGQVLLGKGGKGFPEAADQLEKVIRLGVQPTVGGRVVPALKRDVAIVQIQCASGTSRVIQP